MTISTNSIFQNAIVGQLMAGSDIDVHKITALPEFSLGVGFERGDGARFRYGHAGGVAINRGVFVSTDFSNTSIVDTDNKIIAPASAVAIPNENINAGDIGSRFLQFTLASVTAAQFAGGYFSTTDEVGEGFTYRIKGNTATGNPATGDIRIELYDKIKVALTATTDAAITGCLWNDLKVTTSGTDALVSGVTMASLTATQPYGWFQTRGVATVLCDLPGTIGQWASISDSVAGAYQDAAGDGTAVTDLIAEPYVGYIITPGDSSGHGVLYITLE